MNIFDKIMSKKVAIWGGGNNLIKKIDFVQKYIKPIIIIDSDKEKCEKEIIKGIKCKLPSYLDNYNIDIIIISIEERFIAKQLEQQLKSKYLVYHLNYLFDEIQIKQQEAIVFPKYNNRKIKHFSCEVGSCVCNLKCSYCYVDFMDPRLKENAYFPHTVEFMLRALSPERLGGTAFFNICGEGETLLKPGFINMTQGLLEMGHYVGIITNGTVTEKINELISLPDEIKRRLLLQCSLHYIELKKQNKLSVYFNNVNRARKANLSVSVTMPGSDEYLKYREEIKLACMNNIGVLPGISPIRKQESKGDGFPNGSSLPWEKYMEEWNDFESRAIEMRNGTLNKINIDCFAGMSSGWINLVTGDFRSCCPGEYLDNIYEDITRPIRFRQEPFKCPYEYCSHSGMFLSGRKIEGVNLPSWYEMWARDDANKENLFVGDMKKATHYINEY